MAVLIDPKAIEENNAGTNQEDYHVPTGKQVVNVVSYAELGRHTKMFQGKPAVYASGKSMGQIKPPELMISMIYEFSGAQYSGDYPLCYITSIYLGQKGFANHLSVSDDFINNRLSMQFVNKTGYKKMLDAINLHYGTQHRGLLQTVGMSLLVNCKTVAIGEINGKTEKLLDYQVPGYDKKQANKNIKGWKYFTDIKPEGIMPMVQDFMGELVDMSKNIKPVIGTYTALFDWDAPDKEAWAGLMPFQKKAIVNAEDFRTSKFGQMVAADAELQEEVQAIRNGKSNTKEQEQEESAINTPSGTAYYAQPELPV